MDKTLFITDNKGNGIATAVTNDPTFTINLPKSQVVDISKEPESKRREIRDKPEEFNRQLKKIQKREDSKQK